MQIAQPAIRSEECNLRQPTTATATCVQFHSVLKNTTSTNHPSPITMNTQPSMLRDARMILKKSAHAITMLRDAALFQDRTHGINKLFNTHR
jgi:hypothetical protein